MTSDSASKLAEIRPPDMASLTPGHRAFSLASWVVLGYTLLVIIFGAFVRASLSGDGCGTSWPLCHGEILPIGIELKRYIEFSHRVSSGFLLPAIIGMYIWSLKLFSPGHLVRKAAKWAVICTLVSALIGAVLVLREYVVYDKSLGRAITMPIHLMNTFVMLAAMVAMAYFSAGKPLASFKNQGAVGSSLKLAMGGLFALGITGAISAMGTTAFSAEMAMTNGLMNRLNMHVGADAHPILRGGVLHPIVATAVGLIVIFACRLVMERRPKPQVTFWGQTTVGLYVASLIFGTVNLLASAPLWMQLVHLGMALAIWMALVMLAFSALDVPESMESSLSDESQSIGATKPSRSVKSVLKAYVTLTKPRVISLLLFTTVAAMFIAAGGGVPWTLVLAVTIGGYLAAGSANAYNMVIERDIDVAMERTSQRPTVTHEISTTAALVFATTIGLLSFGILWFAAHPLAAWMALCGLLCYVFVYTLWLKRRTWQNIVIGGAAGAFPPLVGWAAVTGELSPYAWFLFALILTWTPVHFWALAILIKEDYEKAGVPMLPVVKGDRVTVIQITLYAIITVILCAAPVLQGEAGPVYLAGAILLNFGLLLQSFGLLKDTSRPRARALFKYSMVYLALIFIVMALDRVVAV